MVLEVGPGTGNMTVKLLEKAKKVELQKKKKNHLFLYLCFFTQFLLIKFQMFSKEALRQKPHEFSVCLADKSDARPYLDDLISIILKTVLLLQNVMSQL